MFKRVDQEGVAKLAFHARQKDTGRHLISTGSLSGNAYYNRYTILFIQWRTTDIPEKK